MNCLSRAIYWGQLLVWTNATIKSKDPKKREFRTVEVEFKGLDPAALNATPYMLTRVAKELKIKDRNKVKIMEVRKTYKLLGYAVN